MRVDGHPVGHGIGVIGKTRRLKPAGDSDAGGDFRGAFRRGRQGKIGGPDRWHVDMKIDAIEQWPGDFGLVVGSAARHAPAGQRGIIAATSWNRAGYVTCALARAITARPDSSG